MSNSYYELWVVMHLKNWRNIDEDPDFLYWTLRSAEQNHHSHIICTTDNDVNGKSVILARYNRQGIGGSPQWRQIGDPFILVTIDSNNDGVDPYLDPDGPYTEYIKDPKTVANIDKFIMGKFFPGEYPVLAQWTDDDWESCYLRYYTSNGPADKESIPHNISQLIEHNSQAPYKLTLASSKNPETNNTTDGL